MRRLYIRFATVGFTFSDAGACWCWFTAVYCHIFPFKPKHPTWPYFNYVVANRTKCRRHYHHHYSRFAHIFCSLFSMHTLTTCRRSWCGSLRKIFLFRILKIDSNHRTYATNGTMKCKMENLAFRSLSHFDLCAHPMSFPRIQEELHQIHSYVVSIGKRVGLTLSGRWQQAGTGWTSNNNK